MVYCGAPSKSCAPCRRKRLKCDLVRPGCGQCRRAATACHGYRNDLDLAFRHETEKVIEQHKTHSTIRLRSTSRKSPPDTITFKSIPFKDSVPSRDLTVAPRVVDITLNEGDLAGIQPSITELATNFLISTWAPGSHFAYLPALLSNTSSIGTLPACIQAVGLAGISHELAQPGAMTMARHGYANALRQVNSALADPKEAILDETLASIMLLSLFETMAHGEEDSADIWSRHVNGASALLVLRGSKQFKSAIGTQLFMQVCSSIRVSCIMQERRIPPKAQPLFDEAAALLPHDSPGLQFGHVADAFAVFRADIAGGHLVDPLVIIAQAQKIDEMAEQLAINMPRRMLFDICQSHEDHPAIYGRAYHLYNDHRTAQLWNTIRMTRLMLSAAILKCLEDMDPKDLTNYYTLHLQASLLIPRMAAEIVASVPQYTGFAAPGLAPVAPIVAAQYFLVWPLRLVAESSQMVGEAMTRYAIERLRYIGRQTKTGRVLEIADGLETGEAHSSSDWSHAYHLF